MYNYFLRYFLFSLRKNRAKIQNEFEKFPVEKWYSLRQKWIVNSFVLQSPWNEIYSSGFSTCQITSDTLIKIWSEHMSSYFLMSSTPSKLNVEIIFSLLRKQV